MKKLIIVPLLIVGLQGLAQTDTLQCNSLTDSLMNCKVNPFDYNSPEWWDYEFKDLQFECGICKNKKANNGIYVQGWIDEKRKK